VRAALVFLGGLVVALALWQGFGAGDRVVRRVAVLPLASPAGDAELRAFADGVADDIATALTPSGIEVMARAMTSGDQRTRLSGARSAGAAYAIEGAVQRIGADIHVTTRIVSTGDMVARWSQAISEPAVRLRGLRNAAAARTADAASCGFARGASRLDSESQTLLFTACALPVDEEHPMKMRDLMQKLRKRVPRFAYAHAVFADATSYVVRRGEFPESELRSLRTEARSAAETARRLDPDLGDSYVALYRLAAGPPAAIEAPLREGLRRDPSNASLNAAYGEFLLRVGRLEEALLYAKRAEALAPLSAERRGEVAHKLFAAGEMEQALARAEPLAALWPEDSTIGLARLSSLFWQGRYEEALALTLTTDRHGCWRRSVRWLQRADPAGRREGAREARTCHRDVTWASSRPSCCCRHSTPISPSRWSDARYGRRHTSRSVSCRRPQPCAPIRASCR